MNHKLEAFLVNTVVFALAAAPTLLSAAPWGYWKLDDPNGTVAHDSSGNNAHGQLLGDLTFDKGSTDGVLGRALELDGINDGILIPKSFEMPTDAWTIAFWFNPRSTLSASSPQVNFWSGRQAKFEGRPAVVFNKQQMGRIGLYVELGGGPQSGQIDDILTTTDRWDAGTWHHVAFTFDGQHFAVYVNGDLENTITHPGSHLGARMFYVGISSQGTAAFAGKIDDIRIYSYALPQEEILQFGCSEPQLQQLVRALARARQSIDHNDPASAIRLLEATIAQAEHWKSNNPNKYPDIYDRIAFAQHLALARAQKAAGLPPNVVAATCKKALTSNRTPGPSELPRLVTWLYQNLTADWYLDVVQPLIEDNPDFLLAAARTGAQMLKNDRPKDAVTFLQRNIDAHARWTHTHPGETPAAEPGLPEVYLQLGIARTKIAAPAADIAAAYAHAFGPWDLQAVPERISAMFWLLDRSDPRYCRQALEAMTRDATEIRPYAAQLVRQICRHFELNKNWAGFRFFLDALVDHAKRPGKWLLAVESSFADNRNRWARKYFSYIHDRPELTLARDGAVAEEYVGRRDFAAAADLYRRVIGRCPPGENKQLYHFQLCKCLYYGSGCAQAQPCIDRFITQYQHSRRDLVRQLMLMKSRALIQLDKPQQALDTLVELKTRFPGTKHTAEVDFCTGYCLMLQHKWSDARTTFERLISENPDSSYARKARLCLTRLKLLEKPK